ncbi:MAG: bacterioferritin [Desulfovibrionaceae bacterium]|nr:bacterioferritin [Desulfovibrionaceae bacterium]MBF0514343.1 bacterioferritin [Desulfovibrionaceae bacterium]
MDKKAQSQKEAGKAKVVAALNKARDMELQAITLYMNQHYTLDNLDYGELAMNMKLIAIDEMRHAEMFAERVKELGGQPVPMAMTKLALNQDLSAVYPFDAGVEDNTLFVYNGFLQVCRENGDAISEKLFEAILEEEQVHFNYFENVGGHIKRLGEAYLSKIAGTPSSTGPSTKGFALKKTGA